MSDEIVPIEPQKNLIGNSINPAELEKMLEVQKTNRKLLLEYAEGQLKEGSDYHLIKGKKSLGKPGAEKFCSLFNITIGKPEVDQDTFERLPQEVKDKGAIILRVELFRNGEYIGSGVGARTLTQDAGDLNKAMKMAKKSAIIDAVLSTFGLSDLFTQDIEDMSHISQGGSGSDSKSEFPPSEKQIKFIKDLFVKKQGLTENTAKIKVQEVKSSQQAKTLIDTLLKKEDFSSESQSLDDDPEGQLDPEIEKAMEGDL